MSLLLGMARTSHAGPTCTASMAGQDLQQVHPRLHEGLTSHAACKHGQGVLALH